LPRRAPRAHREQQGDDAPQDPARLERAQEREDERGVDAPLTPTTAASSFAAVNQRASRPSFDSATSSASKPRRARSRARSAAGSTAVSQSVQSSD
jgi:hypothetical protein